MANAIEKVKSLLVACIASNDKDEQIMLALQAMKEAEYSANMYTIHDDECIRTMFVDFAKDDMPFIVQYTHGDEMYIRSKERKKYILQDNAISIIAQAYTAMCLETHITY